MLHQLRRGKAIQQVVEKETMKMTKKALLRGKHGKIIRKLWRIILDYTSSHHDSRQTSFEKEAVNFFTV